MSTSCRCILSERVGIALQVIRPRLFFVEANSSGAMGPVRVWFDENEIVMTILEEDDVVS